MRLSAKVMTGVAMVITTVNVTLFYLMGRQYETLLTENLLDTARTLYKQIIVTRAWIAQHGGVFVRYKPGMEANPYLDLPGTCTASGDSLLLRNPALVTRELSEMSSTMGERFRFHLTSLDPINPDNLPNDFERKALTTLAQGEHQKVSRYGEFTRMESLAGKSYFHYFAPLYTEESCLSCHGRQGYKVGDIRGGISIIIPTDKVDAAKARNHTFMILACLLASSAISLLVYSSVRKTVITPLRRLEQAAEQIGQGNYQAKIPVWSRDEIGDLGRALAKMQVAIQSSVSQQIEREKMFALGQLAAGIAHEIRNPLFAIRNNLYYLRRHSPENGDQGEVYQEMEEGIGRMSRIVNAVLDYAKPHPPEFGRYHLREVLDRCLALLGKQLEKENVKLSVRVDENVPPIHMDIHLMEQVFVNLLTNAREAVRGKRGEINLAVRRVKDQVMITISDNGYGIKAADLPRIFDPFFTRTPHGTGLGLTIVRRIVEQHGGSIQVRSREGEGTTFTLHLPIEQKVEVLC